MHLQEVRRLKWVRFRELISSFHFLHLIFNRPDRKWYSIETMDLWV
jgi:hypothetical protein